MKTDSILAKIGKAKKSIERLNGVIAKNEAKLAKGGDRFDCECAIHIAEEDLRRRQVDERTRLQILLHRRFGGLIYQTQTKEKTNGTLLRYMQCPD